VLFRSGQYHVERRKSQRIAEPGPFILSSHDYHCLLDSEPGDRHCPKSSKPRRPPSSSKDYPSSDRSQRQKSPDTSRYLDATEPKTIVSFRPYTCLFKTEHTIGKATLTASKGFLNLAHGTFRLDSRRRKHAPSPRGTTAAIVTGVPSDPQQRPWDQSAADGAAAGLDTLRLKSG
jgi:hypothetical protein